MQEKVVWRSASMRPGGLFVTTLGTTWMPMWSAQALVSPDSVRYYSNNDNGHEYNLPDYV